MEEKLLICLAIVLFLTLVWTVIACILYRIYDKNRTAYRHSKLDVDNLVVTRRVKTESLRDVEKRRIREEKELRKEEERYLKAEEEEIKRRAKLEDEKEEDIEEEIETQRVDDSKYRVKKVARELETYVKIKFHGSQRVFIYVAPPRQVLVEKQKIKVRIDEDTVRSATVIKGNYTREKYKSFEYKTLEVVEN